MNKKINKLKQVLDIPNPDVKLIYPKEFLNKISGLIEKQDKNNKDNVDQFAVKVNEVFSSLLTKIDEVNKKVDVTDKKIDEKIDGIKEIKVTNFPEQKEIVIPEPLKEIEVKQPKWYEKFVPDKILEYIDRGFKQSGKDFATALDRHKELKNALAVRLVDKDLQTFYNAIAYAASSGGGSSGGVTTINNWPVDYPNAALLALVTLLNNKFVSGTDIGDVTINNGNLANAVNIQDGGNSITVDGSVAVGGSVQLENSIGNIISPAEEGTLYDVFINTSYLNVSSNLYGGGKIAVGTAQVEVTLTGTTETIVIQADKDNTGLLFVGKTGVTNAGANALCFLEAGDSVTLFYDDVTNPLYVISDTAGQNFWKGALL